MFNAVQRMKKHQGLKIKIYAYRDNFKKYKIIRLVYHIYFKENLNNNLESNYLNYLSISP